MSYSSEIAIQVENLSKCFKFYSNKWRRLKGALFGGTNHAQEVWAVRDLNFELPRGCTLGIIGVNGAGKTTLLQLLAGLLKPTRGTVQVRGTLATLLELGSGFVAELTGRENIFVSGGLQGFSKKQVEKKIPDIIAFSELEEFIDRPVKHYSAGMLMRLAFATAINVEPDILLIDEIFAVGDLAFQHKCIRKFRELQKKGVTVVLVTHDMAAAKSLCDMALLLDHGSQVKFSNPEEVTNYYLNLVAQKVAKETLMEQVAQKQDEELEPSTAEFMTDMPMSEKVHRHGDGSGRICAVQILNTRMLPTKLVAFGEEVLFRFYLEYVEDVLESGLGFFIRDRFGIDVLGINTFEEQRPLGSRKKGDRLIVDFKLSLYLRAGSYSVSPGFSYHRSEPRYMDWIDNALIFEMERPISGKEIYGFMHVPNQVSIQLLK